MNWTIEFVENGGYFRLVSSGLYEVGDSVMIFADLFAHPRWRPGTPILMDRRGVDYRNVTYEVMSRAGRELEAQRDAAGSSLIAYLVGTPAAFGVSRQIQNLMNENFATTIEVFTDEREAINWLTESDGQ